MPVLANTLRTRKMEHKYSHHLNVNSKGVQQVHLETIIKLRFENGLFLLFIVI